MTTKNCTTCKKSKPLSEFVKHKRRKDGRGSVCKLCDLIRVGSYRKTKDGLTSTIYSHQLLASRKRGHNPPDYTLNEFRRWVYSQPIFHTLFNHWVNSNYNRWLRPSCDRADDYQGYSLNRLTIMTWQENFDKGHSDRKNGHNNKGSKPIIQMNIDGTFVSEFYSSMECERKTGIARNNISTCCHGRQKTAGGYRWMIGLRIKIHNNQSGAKQ